MDEESHRLFPPNRSQRAHRRTRYAKKSSLAANRPRQDDSNRNTSCNRRTSYRRAYREETAGGTPALLAGAPQAPLVGALLAAPASSAKQTGHVERGGEPPHSPRASSNAPTAPSF